MIACVVEDGGLSFSFADFNQLPFSSFDPILGFRHHPLFSRLSRLQSEDINMGDRSTAIEEFRKSALFDGMNALG